MGKVAVLGLLGAFVVFYAVTSPANAAHIVHSGWGLAVHQGWHAVVGVAHGVGRFIDSVSS